MKWFRLYNEVYSDPKVQALRPELFRFWVNVMCIASDSEPRGLIPSDAKLQRLLCLNGPTVKRYLSDLEASGLLCRESAERAPEDRRGYGDPLMPHCWDERQPSSDDAAERKKRSRAKTYVKPENEMSRDTNVTDCDPRVRPRSLDLDRDKDTDKEERVRIYADESKSDPAFQYGPTEADEAELPSRSGDDLAKWNSAGKILAACEKTKSLASSMRALDGTPSVSQLDGWRFLHAAQIAIGKPESVSWNYFLAIATRCTLDQFENHGKPTSSGGRPEKLAPYQQPAVKQPFTDQFAASFAGVKK